MELFETDGQQPERRSALALVQTCVTCIGHLFERAIKAVRPCVIRASEASGVAERGAAIGLLAGDQLGSTVAANIVKCFETSIFLPYDQY